MDASRVSALGPTPALKTRTVLAAVAATLTLLPAALTLARQAEFASKLVVLPAPQAQTREFQRLLPLDSSHASYVARLLGSYPTLFGITTELKSFASPDELLRMLAVERTGLGATVTARADTPQGARDLAVTAGLQLVAASSRETLSSAKSRRAAVSAELRRALRRRRPRLVRERAFLSRVVATPPSRVYPADHPTKPALRGVDALVDRLPGAFPPRPSPLLVALAGLLVSAFVVLAGLSLARRRAPPPG